MNSVKLFFVFSLSAALCYAQTFNISGVVKDNSGKVLEGATVSLGLAGLSTKTGADGCFKLTSNISHIQHTGRYPASEATSLFLKDGRLTFRTFTRANIVLVLYSINGKRLHTHTETVLAGSHSLQLPNTSQGMYICHLRINTRCYTFKSINGIHCSSYSLYEPQKSFPAKKIAEPVPFHDALLVSMEEFYLTRLSITNPDTSGIQIALNPLMTGTVADTEGNVYKTITYGTQEWTIDNLRSTKFNDGTPIPLITDSASWTNSTTPGFCFYNNSTNPDQNKKWGALYNWYAVHTGKLAPVGWHVPSNAEWDTLQNYLINNGYNYNGIANENLIAIAMASKTDWETFTVEGAPGQNPSVNNSSGFTALPAGHRTTEGIFEGQGFNAHWWCTTESEFDSLSALDHEIYYYFWYLGSLPFSKTLGSSVRLVRDN